MQLSGPSPGRPRQARRGEVARPRAVPRPRQCRAARRRRLPRPQPAVVFGRPCSSLLAPVEERQPVVRGGRSLRGSGRPCSRARRERRCVRARRSTRSQRRPTRARRTRRPQRASAAPAHLGARCFLTRHGGVLLLALADRSASGCRPARTTRRGEGRLAVRPRRSTCFSVGEKRDGWRCKPDATSARTRLCGRAC